MPVLSKAGANLRHTARAATLALNFDVGDRGVPGLQATAPGVCATEFISIQLEGDERPNLAFQGATNRQIGGICEVESFVDCLILIASFEGDCLSDTTAHAGKIPPAPFLIESLYCYHAFRVANRQMNMEGYDLTSE